MPPFLAAPPVIEQTHSLFDNFYRQKHNGRKLIWIYSLSRGTLLAQLQSQSPPHQHSYELQVSGLQLTLLLFYNDTDVLSIEQLSYMSRLPHDDLKNVLAGLIKSKLLLPLQDEQYAVNLKFSSYVQLNDFRFTLFTPSQQTSQSVCVFPFGCNDRRRIAKDISSSI